MINVTKTFLPPLQDYQKYLQEIWSSNQVANGGQLWFQLQAKLKEYLGSPDLILTTNGTLPLQIALKCLAGKGEVITTPFSYVATTAAIVWENCTPVFVDIHPEFWTIDETKIEAAITERTTAILATHVFGNPCEVEEIARIADKYNLKVIYDAAHCFGVKYKGKSIFHYGHVSTCSFHATKIFHTGEGGAMFCKDPGLFEQLFYSHNFGHSSATSFSGLGINAKMSELQAGMGLAVLPYIDELIQKRRILFEVYMDSLKGSAVSLIKLREETLWNFGYFPVLFDSQSKLLQVQNHLQQNSVIPRRYFYPALNALDFVRGGNFPIAENVSDRILCLPLHHDLDRETVRRICSLIKSVFSK